MARAGDGYHPGPPRFVQVGERLVDPVFVDAAHGLDRDNLAPGIPDPGRDPSNYGADQFEWSIAEQPSGSSATIEYAPAPFDDADQYDAGRHNAAEFEADAAGRYVLELSAPDGTHRQAIHVFPGAPGSAGGPPRIEMEGRLEGGEFVVETNPRLAPDSNATPADFEVVALADDRDGLSNDDVTVDGTTVRVPASAVDGSARLHAAAFDGEVHSTTDTVELDADAGRVTSPNRPPEWIEEGVLYEIFTRSFAGAPGETTFEYMRDKVDYLADLGVDVVWLTPVVPAVSSNCRDRAGGGPHGYDALSYFDVAPDLGEAGTREAAMDAYRAFVDACHDRGIRVCFDFVVSHVGRDHPFFRDAIGREAENPPFPDLQYPSVEAWNEDSKYFDWFDRRAGPLTYEGREVDAAPASTGFFGLRVMPNLNYGNLALREHVLAAADFWSGEVGVDAFRCDIAWGVPHSLWKEVREVCRANDSEFVLLDETIPNDPSFSENEFDLHFDTADFTNTVHAVGEGSTPAQDLYWTIVRRKNEGFPDHALLVNACENHDERRMLRLAIDEGSRSNPEKAQRAGYAASVALPGVPMIYYGQERQISKYGENRYDYDGTGDDRDGDVGPGKYKRAFVNWAEDGDYVPESHLAFYRNLTRRYHDLDVLKPDADLVPAWHRADSDDVLVFGRETDDRSVVVVVNFGDGPAEVDLRANVSTRDLVDDVDVGVPSEGPTTTVEVGTVAVLETPALFDPGEAVATLPDPEGDDGGSGSGSGGSGGSGSGGSAART